MEVKGKTKLRSARWCETHVGEKTIFCEKVFLGHSHTANAEKGRRICNEVSNEF